MSLFNEFDNDDDEYAIVDLDSDDEDVQSSSGEEEIDEDIDIPKVVNCVNDDEDDFEKEMQQELEKKIINLEEKNEIGSKLAVNKEEPEELLYDPHADEADQIWMDTVHHVRAPLTTSAPTSSLQSLSASEIDRQRSDAVLNCPGCMSVLTTDCQRHDRFESQYRAMFVSNCHQGEPLSYARNKKKTHYDHYTTVLCTVCGSKVGLMDEDEVYHFFNVLASY